MKRRNHTYLLCLSMCLATLVWGCADEEGRAARAPDNNGDTNNDSNGDTNNDSNGDTNNTNNTNNGDSDCLTDAEYFQTFVWEPILSSRCVVCHIDQGLASATRMVLKTPDAPDFLEHNLSELTKVAEVEVEGIPLLVLKPSGQTEEPHPGGQLIEPDSTEYNRVFQMAKRLRGEAGDCDEEQTSGGRGCETLEPGPRVLRRLTHLEYRNTVRDLLSVEVDEGALPADIIVHNFNNNAESLNVSPLLVDRYRNLAEEIAAQAPLQSVIPCSIVPPTSACALEFITTFGLRAFRRPLTTQDKEKYLTFFTSVAEEDGMLEGIRWVIVAMLQSPHFLYRTELGRRQSERFELTSWELASALSYLILGTMPDEALMERAATGEIYDPAILEQEANRLLDNPRSSLILDDFSRQWLGLEQLPNVTRDRDLYPELTPEIRAAMAGETQRFIQEAWTGGQTLSDLLVAQHSYMTDELIDFYGLEPAAGAEDADGFKRVELSGTPYGGLLTQGSLMMTHSLPTHSSPIHRGILVRERVLCQELPEPPANIDNSPPENVDELTTRERYIQHSQDPACAVCHKLIDPIGFAFEPFDTVGRYREDDRGLPIDESGYITQTSSTDGTFESTDELLAMLASSADVEACYVEQWLRYGYGLSETFDVECYSEELQREFSGGGSQLRSVMVAMVKTPHFTHRVGGEEEGDLPGGADLPLSSSPTEPAFDPSEDPALPDDPPSNPTGNSDLPAPTQGITYEVVEDSRWNAGMCASVFVHNVTDAPIVWEVYVDVEGNINNLWNSTRLGDTGVVKFTGVDWNSTLAARSDTDFGFCTEF